MTSQLPTLGPGGANGRGRFDGEVQPLCYGYDPFGGVFDYSEAFGREGSILSVRHPCLAAHYTKLSPLNEISMTGMRLCTLRDMWNFDLWSEPC